MLGAIDLGRSSGARILAGGQAPERDGWFVQPTLVDGLGPDHRLSQEETFGPLVTILTAADVDEAVRIANGVRYGLVTSVHGRDLDRVLAAADGLDTGLIKVNAPTTGVDFYAPFGGEKDSSYGPREQGMAALGFYSSTRTITIAAARRLTARYFSSRPTQRPRMCLMCELIKLLVAAVSLRPHRVDQLVMLLRGCDEHPRLRERDEAEQPRLAPHPIDQLGETVVAELGDQQHVVAPVGIQVVDQVAARGGGDDLVRDLRQLIEDLRSDDLRDLDGRRHLEQETDLTDLVKVDIGHLHHPEAAVSFRDHETVLGEIQHRLSDRRRGYAEALAERGR